MTSVTSPCFAGSWICESLTVTTFTPRSRSACPASSEATRGFGWLGSNSSSAAATPGVDKPMAVLDAMTSGRAVPANAAPSASMARRSFRQFSTKCVKSWSKAVWITPSQAAAPRCRPARSSMSPRYACARGGQRRRPLVRAGQAKHLVARREQFTANGGSDETGGACQEDTHGCCSDLDQSSVSPCLYHVKSSDVIVLKALTGSW